MSQGVTNIDLIINRRLSVSIPIEVLNFNLFRTEFDLLTNDPEGRRKIYKTQSFNVPIADNEEVINAIRTGFNDCQLFINNYLVLSGYIIEYSQDDQHKTININIVSNVKSLIDYIGNNVLFLDIYDFSADNFIIADFTDASSTDLMKFGQFKPIDKTTGDIEYNSDNVNDYCQPSIMFVEYFKRVFEKAGWSANWDIFNSPPKSTATIILKNVGLIPIKNYLCSSFGFNVSDTTITVPANSAVKIPFTTPTWNINTGGTNGCTPNFDGTITVNQPNRLTQFKLIGNYNANLPFLFSVSDGTEEFLSFDATGQTQIRQYSNWINPLEEGLDPVFVDIINNNEQDLILNIESLTFYNLFSVLETDQFNFLTPQGYYYPISDNYKDVTVLDLFRQFLSKFQVAFSVNESKQDLSFYFIDNIASKEYNTFDVNPFLLWDGYVSLGDQLDGTGLAKFNAVRYLNDSKRQYFFKINLTNLPSSGIHLESIFLPANDDKLWQSLCVPNLKYKVKNIDVFKMFERFIRRKKTSRLATAMLFKSFVKRFQEARATIAVEFLNYEEIEPMIGYYVQIDPGVAAAMQFEQISINNIVQQFWPNIVSFLSTSISGKNPTMFELVIKQSLVEYLNNMTQNTLFQYTEPCIMMDGEYDPMRLEFKGKFLSLR